MAYHGGRAGDVFLSDPGALVHNQFRRMSTFGNVLIRRSKQTVIQSLLEFGVT